MTIRHSLFKVTVVLHYEYNQFGCPTINDNKMFLPSNCKSLRQLQGLSQEFVWGAVLFPVWGIIVEAFQDNYKITS